MHVTHLVKNMDALHLVAQGSGTHPQQKIDYFAFRAL
jgi:hypothetical protein